MENGKWKIAARPPSYTAALNLQNVPVLIVGGGPVAARKAATLVDCRAKVTVVSPTFDPALLSLKESLSLIQRRYKSSDLNGARLVFAATNDSGLNTQICAAAAKKSIWANSATPPEAGSFSVPATVSRGAFTLSVSTQGSSAALSAYWRKRLEKIAGPEWGDFAALLEKMRAQAKQKIADPEVRRAFLISLARPHWAAKIKELGVKKVEEQMSSLIKQKAVSRRAAAQ